jgi:anti-sigma B factor antagonist
MDIPVEQIDGVAVAEIPVDELDANNSGDLKRAMAPILDRYAKLVIDMGRLRFVDSSGLGAILSCLRQVSAKGGDLKLCAMSKQVRATFELVRMHKIFDILATREEAAHAFQTRPSKSLM